MLFFHVFVATHPRLSPRSENVQTCGHSDVQTSFTPNSLPRHTSENSPVSSLAATLMDLPASVANKRLTTRLSPLDATLTKSGGLPPSSQIFFSLLPHPDVRTFRPADAPACLRIIPFIFFILQTHLHNGRCSTLLESIPCGHFSSRRRVYPLRNSRLGLEMEHPTRSELPTANCRLSTLQEGGDGDRSQGCAGPRGRTLSEDQARLVWQSGVTSG